HFDGHHFWSLSFGIAGCACAVEIGASEYLPCIGPASGAAKAPAAPTVAAVLRKVRRSGDADDSSGLSIVSVMAFLPYGAAGLRVSRLCSSAMENYPAGWVECPGDDQPFR